VIGNVRGTGESVEDKKEVLKDPFPNLLSPKIVEKKGFALGWMNAASRYKTG
jgi:hypothetical protein